MQINTTENVIFLKDVESNIIEEAFIILKENVKLKFFRKNGNMNNINVLKEAESLINQELHFNKLQFEKFKIEKLNKKIKLLKVTNLINIIILLYFFFIK